MAKTEAAKKFLSVVLSGDPNDAKARKRAWTLYIANQGFHKTPNMPLNLMEAQLTALAEALNGRDIDPTRLADLTFGIRYGMKTGLVISRVGGTQAQIEASKTFRLAMVGDISVRM